jgi:hypothetical protein
MGVIDGAGKELPLQIPGTVKLMRIRPILGQDLLKPKPGINDLAVAEGGENGTKELNLTVPARR